MHEDVESSNAFPVVGIGASAGGLEAVKELLQAIPADSGMAYVFIQHLSPTHESTLPSILEPYSKIPVLHITDNVHLEPNHFYIVPSNKLVNATDGILKLAPLDDQHRKLKVIDLFFSSLASVHQAYAVGVILSGLLADGTQGLLAIKAYGGITFAQDEASATFPDMPGNAARAGGVDFILPPGKIVDHLLTINHPFHTTYSVTEIAQTLPEKDEEVFKQLIGVLLTRRGVDFTYYKPNTLKRRIVRRMAINNIEKPEQYLKFLKGDKTEQDALYNDMLISVTDFFRDTSSFDLLCNTIFPAILKSKTANDPVRIWIAGCATGEEAYSMAICLLEYLGERASALKIQIFATDISERAIAKARTGIYRSSDLQGVSASRLAQFFAKTDGCFQVSKDIRDMCVFAQHNLLKDPPFSNMDLVSCRNVLIYMEKVLQKRALTTFHYALKEKGYLMLGKSENIESNSDIFTSYNKQEKIFQRIGLRGKIMPVATLDGEQRFKEIDRPKPVHPAGNDIFKTSDALILSNYAPPSVLVNSRFDILQFRGKTDSWLSAPQGRASFNVLKMARNDLAFELKGLLNTAKATNLPIGKENLLFHSDEELQYVNIKIAPIIEADEIHFLIIFEKVQVITIPDYKQTKSDQPGLIDPKDLRIAQQNREIAQARADMKTVIDEQEAVNEALQQVNEELLSGSEELQSLNEELETSKEELQSTNEEITIINNELLDRNEQLNNSRRYAEGIINTIRDPLLVLDLDLKIKRASDGFYNKFKVSENETEGKYLFELSNGQWAIPKLMNLLRNIISERKDVVNFEVTHTFPVIGRLVMCLNARQLDKINGEQLILLAIEDITAKRKVEEGLAEVEKLFTESKERLRLAVDAAGLGTWDYNLVTGEMIWDYRCKEMFWLKQDEPVSYNIFMELVLPEDRGAVDTDLKYILAGNNNGDYEKEFRIRNKIEGEEKWIKLKGKAYANSEGIVYRLVGTALDVSTQRLLQEHAKELLRQKDDFISIASHELKTPITSLKGCLQVLHQSKNDIASNKVDMLLAICDKSLSRMSTLIEDLLNASRANQGQLQLNEAGFVISKIIEECCYPIRMASGCSIMIEGDLELQAYGDADRIQQVITNFVNNAIKYASGSKTVNIKIEGGVDGVKVSVIDHGPGIPAENQPHLFDRFYRAEKLGFQYSGLGLGLFISSEIIKKHGGGIGVESEVGKGSTFWFTLPCA
jgi:two-component system CheB/CheR fusion protein